MRENRWAVGRMHHPPTALVAIVAALVLIIGVVALGLVTSSPNRVIPSPFATAVSAAPSASASGSRVTLLAAGDIAECGNSESEATARTLAGLAGTIATLGDNAYERGTAAEYAHCFGPTWGALRDRIRPAPGNHEYLTTGATPYLDYFGSTAGPRGLGYYSYDLGAWHIIVLNSNCSSIGGSGTSSPANVWLRADLSDSNPFCTLAVWHYPRRG